MSNPPINRYWIIARDKPGLLIAMMRALAGSAQISFEGDLSRCPFPAALGPSSEETEVLRRHTAHPKQDFVILPLPSESIRPILDILLPEGRCVKDILHIQIATNDGLQFGSYDQFHSECIVGFPPGVSPDLLDQLQSSGIIRSWTVPNSGAQRWHG